MHFNESGIRGDSVHYFSMPSDALSGAFCHTVSAGHFFCEPPYYLHRMCYNSFLAILVVDGTLLFRRGGRDMPLRAGALVLEDCCREHCYYTEEPCEFYFFHFDGPGCHAAVEKILQCGGVVPSPHGSAFLPVFEEILNMHAASSPCTQDPYETAALIYRFLCATARASMERGGTAGGEDALDAVIAHVHEHLAEPMTIESLARMTNYSCGHFSRLFRRRTGLSVYRYITFCRIDRARQLLLTTADTVHQIGQTAGFADDANFVRIFEKYVGCSPASFRRMGL